MVVHLRQSGRRCPFLKAISEKNSTELRSDRVHNTWIDQVNWKKRPKIERRHVMEEKQISLGRLFVQEVIRAGTWGIVLLLILGMFMLSIKQEIKEGIAFGVDRVVNEAVMVATDPYLIGKSKQLIKEGIEYTLAKTSGEIRGILNDYTVEIEIEKKAKTK
jgi:hypothetical protein